MSMDIKISSFILILGSISVIGDSALRAAIIVGSLCGALLAMILKEPATRKKGLMEFLAGILIAFPSTPYALMIFYEKDKIVPEVALFASLVIAFMGKFMAKFIIVHAEPITMKLGNRFLSRLGIQLDKNESKTNDASGDAQAPKEEKT